MPEWQYGLARLLARLVLERRPGANVPKSLDSWCREISKIPDDHENIAKAIYWLYSPANEGQYRIEVQSGKALREKYGKVQAAMERAQLKAEPKQPELPKKFQTIQRNMQASEDRANARAQQTGGPAIEAGIPGGVIRHVPER